MDSCFLLCEVGGNVAFEVIVIDAPLFRFEVHLLTYTPSTTPSCCPSISFSHNYRPILFFTARVQTPFSSQFEVLRPTMYLKDGNRTFITLVKHATSLIEELANDGHPSLTGRCHVPRGDAFYSTLLLFRHRPSLIISNNPFTHRALRLSFHIASS